MTLMDSTKLLSPTEIPQGCGQRLEWQVWRLQDSAGLLVSVVGKGTGFHGRKPQDSAPGILTVLAGLQSATRCCQPTPHTPAVCKRSRILAKLQGLVVPVFYLKTDVCVLVDSDILVVIAFYL